MLHMRPSIKRCSLYLFVAEMHCTSHAVTVPYHAIFAQGSKRTLHKHQPLSAHCTPMNHHGLSYVHRRIHNPVMFAQIVVD